MGIMKMLRPLANLILISVLAIPSLALSQALSIENLQSRCSKKTLVYGRDSNGKVVKTGETVDDYCAGYLEGTLSAMQHAKLACPENSSDKQIDTGFLISVIDTYVKDAGLSHADAGQVIGEAYQRAFPCRP